MLHYILILLLAVFARAEHESWNLPQIPIQVTTDGELGWHFSGYAGLDPNMELQRGKEYIFMMNAPHYQLVMYSHTQPQTIIAQSLASGQGHFSVIFDNSHSSPIRYKAANAIWMHGDITLTGSWERPAPDTSGLYPSPVTPASPLPSPTPSPTSPTPSPTSPTPSPPSCCNDGSAACEACKLGWSVEQYCQYFPNTAGCTADPGPYCCEAIIASCLACQLDMTVEAYCNINPTIAGCEFGSGSEEEVDTSVGSRIILDIDFDTIGTSGSHLRTVWSAMLINEMSIVMGISKDRITIDRLSRGSVVVDFSIHDGPDNELTPEQSLELFSNLILNSGSALWSSNALVILPAANRIKSWPLPQVDGAPMDPPPVVQEETHTHDEDHTHEHAHDESEADHHHHDDEDDPNDHTHPSPSPTPSPTPKDDDDGISETAWILIIAGVVLLFVLVLIYVYVWTKPQHKVIHKVEGRQYRPYMPLYSGI